MMGIMMPETCWDRSLIINIWLLHLVGLSLFTQKFLSAQHKSELVPLINEPLGQHWRTPFHPSHTVYNIWVMRNKTKFVTNPTVKDTLSYTLCYWATSHITVIFFPLRNSKCILTKEKSLWGRDFPPVQTGPGAHPVSCTIITRSFQGVEAAGAWGWPPTPSSAEVLERVELYLYSL